MACLLGCDTPGEDAPTPAPVTRDRRRAPDRRAARLLEGAPVFRSEELGAPTDLALADGRLVVLDAMQDPAIHVLRILDGEHLGSLGPWGSGPGEFTGAWHLNAPAGGDRGVWVYDLQQGRMTLLRVDLLSASSPSPTRPEDIVGEMIRLESSAPEAFVWLGDSLMVATGTFGRGWLGVLDPSGELIRTLGRLPETSPSAPRTVRQHAFQATLVRRPGGRLVGVGTRQASRVQIFDVSDGSVLRAETPEDFEPVFDVVESGGSPVLAFTRETRYGYIDMAATRDALYGLFSGETLGELPDRRVVTGTQVHVFDWQGVLRGRMRLPRGALSIAVDPAGGTLFAGHVRPTPSVAGYRLRDGGRTPAR